MESKRKNNNKIKYAEYYNLEELFDKLYQDSQADKKFSNLFEIISSEENIKLAYRNIKSNKGANTPGVDGVTIKDIAKMDVDEFVKQIQHKMNNYNPKRVKRIEIPKQNGKKRPLGIPCLKDRIIQQSMLQVLEPICEAKFNDNSYGFRPCRSAQHAIAKCYKNIQVSKLYYVVDIDIKGFFDNINHRKLMRQLWTIGIRDTKVLMIIKRMLRAEIQLPNGEIIKPSKGTPQGGILSPLLANVVLNELDWWITSQWENFPEKMKQQFNSYNNKNGSPCKSNAYASLKNNSNLKEMRIVRYADDFKIFCRDYKTALKVKIATEKWLHDRLKLETSPEKTKITNLKKHKSEFLGYILKTRKKRNKLVVESHMTNKAIERTKDNLEKAIENMKHAENSKSQCQLISEYNSIVIGVHNYFQYATDINIDLNDVNFTISKKLQKSFPLKKEGKIRSVPIRKKYGKSQELRWLNDIPIIPIGYIQTKHPLLLKRGANKYSKEYRDENFSSVGNIQIEGFLKHPVKQRSIEYNDNRISKLYAQKGKCFITELPLDFTNTHCHHIVQISDGGSDKYENLVLIIDEIHKVLHMTNETKVMDVLKKYSVNKKQIEKFNKLRFSLGLNPINI